MLEGMNIIGIDEVGRGAWAGPLVIAAVRFRSKVPKGLDDSKKLSKRHREVLAVEISKASDLAVIFYSATQVDSIGLTGCLCEGSLRLASILNAKDGQIIIDGNYNFLRGTKYESQVNTVVKADSSYPEVMAASIIAKVSRDSYMSHLQGVESLRGYSFNSHVGYGTQKHRNEIEEFGVSIIHRLSFKPIKLALEISSGDN
jgi:ribonuclease HII